MLADYKVLVLGECQAALTRQEDNEGHGTFSRNPRVT